MNSNRRRLVLGLDIHDGKFPEFQTVAQEMVAIAITKKEAGGPDLFISPEYGPRALPVD